MIVDSSKRQGILTGCLAMAYALSALLCIQLSRQADGIAAIWIANAILAAGLMLLRRPWAIACAALCFIANATANTVMGDTVVTSMGFATLNVGESVLMVFLARRAKTGARLTSLSRVSRLVLLAILPAALTSGILAGALFYFAFDRPAFDVFRHWFAADFLGTGILLPSLLLLMTSPKIAEQVRRAAPDIIILSLASVMLLISPYPAVRFASLLMAFPAVSAIAFRRGPAAAALAALVIGAMTMGLILARPPSETANADWPMDFRILVVQLFVAGVFFTGLVAAMTMSDQRRLRDLLQRRTLVARRARASADAASRAKTEFLATMSHEIRTPMNSILGFTEVIRRKGGLAEDTTRHIALIERAGSALLTVVNDILDFSKVEAGQVTLSARPARMAGIAQDTLAIVAESARRKGLDIDLTIEGDADVAHQADDHRLRQVLLNLLNNAIKFTDAGKVSVTLSITAGDLSDHVRFAVTDTGVGIAPDETDRLFKRFSQVDGSVARTYGGTGLGLAICKGLVELMDGQIGVESQAGVGSCFWFEVSLPRAEAQAETDVVDELDDGLAARILLVDDHPMNRELGVTFLALLGCETVTARDGFEAIELAKTGSFDAILMDVHMPKMDGLAATRAIRALDGPAGCVPIIAMSADVLPEQIQRCMAAGMVDNVGKPVTLEALHACLARWIGRDAEGQTLAA